MSPGCNLLMCPQHHGPPQVQQQGQQRPKLPTCLPQACWAALVTRLSSRAGLSGRTKDSGHTSKQLLPSPSARSTREFFSNLHQDNMVGLLQPKLTRGRGTALGAHFSFKPPAFRTPSPAAPSSASSRRPWLSGSVCLSLQRGSCTSPVASLLCGI